MKTTEAEKLEALRKMASDAAQLGWFREREARVQRLLDECEIADGGPDFLAAVRALRDYPEFKP